MPMICQIPKDDCYDLPEGRYRATLANVRVKPKPSPNRSDQQQIRLLFAVHIPSISNKNPMAGRTFNLDLKRGSDLRTFVESWLGADWFNSNTTVDFEQLVGFSADITLNHLHHDGYQRPFVNIESIHPVGTLTLSEATDQQQQPADETDWRMVA